MRDFVFVTLPMSEKFNGNKKNKINININTSTILSEKCKHSENKRTPTLSHICNVQSDTQPKSIVKSKHV